MAFSEPPPIRAKFATLIPGPDGRPGDVDISPEWLQWFASFQENVEAAVAGLTLGELRTEITALSQGNVDAIGAAIFGNDYKGVWTARVHVVGNVRSYNKKFYRCKADRTGLNTDNPNSDAAGWELVGSAESFSDIGDSSINALGAAGFGRNYKGKWSARVYVVGDVSYFSGFFYECLVARASTDTADPSVDNSSWSVTTTDSSGNVSQAVSQAVQNAIDAQGTALYGTKYKGAWSAGIFAVGDVSYYSGAFYTCDVTRAATDTGNPETDTASWSIEVATAGGISAAVQDAIDAQAAINFGSEYKGAWKAGSYAAQNVVYYSGFFYEANLARTASHTDNPETDTTGWSAKTVEFMLTGDVTVDLTGVTEGIQNTIDAQGTAAFGSNYKATWGAGVYAVGEVVYHSGAFYTCDVTRAATDTDNPETDAASWSIEVATAGGISAAVQDAINSQGTINFGSNYKGVWKSGAYAVDEVSYYEGLFYECEVIPAIEDYPELRRFSIPSTWGDNEALATIRARAVAANEETTYSPPDPITSDVTPPVADHYMLRWRFLIRSESRWNRATLSMPDGCDDWMHVYLFRSNPRGGQAGAEIGSVKQTVYAPSAVTVDSDITESDWGDPDDDGYYYAMMEAYFGERGGGQIAHWEIGYRIGADVTSPEIVNDAGGIQNITPLYGNPADDSTAWSIKTVDVPSVGISDLSAAVQNAIDAQGTAAFGSNYKATWGAGVYAVGEVVYHSGAFYTCDVVRAATDTGNPAADTASWSIEVAESGGLAAAIQNAIDVLKIDISDLSNEIGGQTTSLTAAFVSAVAAQRDSVIQALGNANYGPDYKGKWAAGVYTVGNVVFHSGRFYECDSARTLANTDNPATDTASWSVIGSSVSLDLSSVTASISDLGSEISAAEQAQIDATARLIYGSDYEGKWAAGVYAVGNVVFYSGSFFECDVVRGASDTNNPATDTASWSVIPALKSDISDLSGGISAAVQDAIDAQARIRFGGRYKATWAAGVYAVGNVVYYSGVFYTCDAVRAATDTNNPATDTASWSAEVSSDDGLSQAVQNAIDAQARVGFGDNYKGKWAAGVYAVGNVVFFSGSFFECDAVRAATDTDSPLVDSSSWSPKASVEAGVTNAINSTVDVVGAATFGTDYKGTWEAGIHAVGDIRSYNVRYYECKVARVAGNTDSPETDASSWTLIGSAVTIRAGYQDNVDALGSSTYGSDYKGLWEAGVHEVGDYRSYSGRFYRCKVARVAGNTDNPSVDNTGWDAVGSSFLIQGDVKTAKQENIDAAARLVFGADYKGLWQTGIFAVGAVVYDDVIQEFYECDVARTAANTDRPSVDVGSWEKIVSLRQNVANSLGLSQVKSQVFTSSGTWVRPNSVGQVRVLLVGGGGGGGGGTRRTSNSQGKSGGGGGGGQLVIADVPVVSNVSVTIASGGIGGISQNSAYSSSAENDGGDSLFGSLLTAFGGLAGRNPTGGPSMGVQSIVSTIAPAGGNRGEAGLGSGAYALPGEAGDNSGGGGGGAVYGHGGDGGDQGISTAGENDGEDGQDGSEGGGGGGGGGAYFAVGDGNDAADGGEGGNGICIVFWTE